MATDYSFNFDFFKIGQAQQAGSARATGNTNEKKSHDIDIAGAAGWNNLADMSIGDSFTRTTQPNENNVVDGVEKNDKVMQGKQSNPVKPLGVAGLNNKQNALSTDKFGGSLGFGMLSTNNEDKADKIEDSGSKFGSLSSLGAQGSTSENEDLQKLAEALDCEANEDVVKEKLENMDAKELAKLDGQLLDIAEDLGLIDEKIVEKKTGVSEKELASNKTKKTDNSKIKFGTMTSGDMV